MSDSVKRERIEKITLPDELEGFLLSSSIPDKDEVRELMATAWEYGYKKRHKEWEDTEPFKGMQ